MTSPDDLTSEYELSELSNPDHGGMQADRQSAPAISDTTRYTATNGETIILTRFSQRDSPIDLELGPHENVLEQTGGSVEDTIAGAWDHSKRWRKYWKIGHFIERSVVHYLGFLIVCWELQGYLTLEDPGGEEAIRASTRTRRIIFIVIPLAVYFGYGVFTCCRHLRLPGKISQVWHSRATTRPENAREQGTGSSTATAHQQQPRDVQNENRGNLRRRLPRERPLAQVPKEKLSLHKAVMSGDEKKVKHLLEQGIEPDATDSEGQTALSSAAMLGFEPIVKLLVEREDVNADSKDRWDRTPLLWAATEEHDQIVELLVERKDVNADAKDRFGRTSLFFAALRGHKQIVELLVEREDVNADMKDNDSQTPLFFAVAGGHQQIVELLVERKDVNANAKDSWGRTPLIWAVKEGQKEIVELLLEREDVNLHTQNEDGNTPLSIAQKKGYEEIAKILEDKGAVMNAKKQL